MADDQYEPNRVLGIPIGRNPNARRDEESQRVLGFPVDSFGPVDLDGLKPLVHPVREFRRWMRQRRLGPYLTGEDEPGPPR
jgi:hypothetical protein